MARLMELPRWAVVCAEDETYLHPVVRIMGELETSLRSRPQASPTRIPPVTASSAMSVA